MPLSIIPSIMTARVILRRMFLFAACFWVAAYGQTASELKQQADALKARGDAAGALELIQKAAEADPKSAGLEDEIGFLLAVLKHSQDAKPHFRSEERRVGKECRSRWS